MHDPNTGMRLYQFLLAAAFSTGVRAADFHVAPGGSDTNAGSPDQPFATLGHALDVVRAWKVGHAGESNRVLLHTGPGAEQFNLAEHAAHAVQARRVECGIVREDGRVG